VCATRGENKANQTLRSATMECRGLTRHFPPALLFHGREGELAVIIAARGMTISSNFLSGLLETDAIVLHCDERHRSAAGRRRWRGRWI